MKRLLLFLILLMLCEVSSARKYERVGFFNPDGTRNVYFCGTVSLTNYVIVESAKTRHQFLIPDSTYQVKKQGVKYWDSKNAYLYLNSFYDVHDFNILNEKVLDYWKTFEFWPKDDNNHNIGTKSTNSDKDVLCPFREVKPTVFLLFFIRGDAINALTFHNIMDGWIKGPLNFKNPYAFYPVYIPYK